MTEEGDELPCTAIPRATIGQASARCTQRLCCPTTHAKDIVASSNRHLPSMETLRTGSPGCLKSHVLMLQSREPLTSVVSFTSASPVTALECWPMTMGVVGFPFMFHLQHRCTSVGRACWSRCSSHHHHRITNMCTEITSQRQGSGRGVRAADSTCGLRSELSTAAVALVSRVHHRWTHRCMLPSVAPLTSCTPKELRCRAVTAPLCACQEALGAHARPGGAVSGYTYSMLP